jgi:hypothetical protein
MDAPNGRRFSGMIQERQEWESCRFPLDQGQKKSMAFVGVGIVVWRLNHECLLFMLVFGR